MKVWRKQPSERLDYDFLFTDWIGDDGDTITEAVVTSPAGIDFLGSSFDEEHPAVKAWFSGGEDGKDYKCSLRITTAKGRIKEVDFIIVVVEI